MKVLLIGATGATGQLILPLLLQAGHTVTAMVRKPEAFTPKHERLRVIPGDARDASAIDGAVQNQDAVVSAFGPRSLKRDDLQETYLGNLVDAMQKQNVKRLVSLSSWGAGKSAPQSPFIFKIMRATVLRHVFDDKDRAEALVDASTLDYTHVRPGRLTDAAARGGVRAAIDGAGLKTVMTRADLAAFMVGELAQNAWVRQAPLIGY